MADKKSKLPILTALTITILALLFAGNCKSSVSESDSFALEISDQEWSLNYGNSSGTIEVVLRGSDVTGIILDSIEMVGDNTSAGPLKPERASYEGTFVKAEFLKNRVMELLASPSAGSTHTVRVRFYVTGQNDRKDLAVPVTVDDQEENDAERTLEIEPSEWSMNYDKSSGTVEAFLRGDNLENIDLDSFHMKGDNPDAEALPASSATLQGDHIHARFPKSLVLALLLDPEPGSAHTIYIGFMETGGTESLELSAEITIEDDEDDEIDPSELELEIEPEEWSLNFDKSSGTVEAFIYGTDIDKIDLFSIQMLGDNTDAEPLAAISATLQGDHIHARFPKNQVIGLLLDPEEGSTHTIIISFLEIDGVDRLELTATITIEEDEDDEGGGDDEEEEPSDLDLQLSPHVWNLNYDKASGNVKAKIRGEGLASIDLDSIEMTGDNSSAAPLIADSASLQGNHISANFPKNQVLELLLNPESGSTHTVTVSFTQEGGSERYEVSAEVSITGN